MKVGTETGEVCNRDGCTGTIQESAPHGSCSCHINPPCSHCVDDRHYCPECDWQGIDDQRNYPISAAQSHYNMAMQHQDNYYDKIKKMMRGELPIGDKPQYMSLGHTHFSMIKEGVYPAGMTREQLLDEIKGTFGGRFEHFGNGKFKYIAYTD